MTDISIYIRDISASDAFKWLCTIFGSLKVLDDAEFIYRANIGGESISIMIQANIENRNICEVYINPNITKWKNNKEFARYTHEQLGNTVLCDPEDSKYAPSQFLQISKNGEEIVEL